MHILITGSSGFIGRALVHRLRNAHRIIALDKALPHPEGAFLAYQVDISDKTQLLSAMEDVKSHIGSRLDFVFHLAAYYEFVNRSNSLYEEVNEKGTLNLLEALKSLEVGTLVFTSSIAVMKACSGKDPLGEDSTTGSPLYYGISKLKAEDILQAYKDAFHVTIIRLAGVYSPYCQLIPLANQIVSIYRKDISSRFLPNGGEGCIPYVHLEDVLDGFERIMQKSQEIPSGSVYIFAEEDYFPYGELYRSVFKEIHDADITLVSIPAWVLKSGVYFMNLLQQFSGRECFYKLWMVDFSGQRFTFSVEKARRELGWHPQHSLRRSLKGMMEILKTNPTDWMQQNKYLVNNVSLENTQNVIPSLR